MADDIIEKVIWEAQFLELGRFGRLRLLPRGNCSPLLSQPIAGAGVGFEDVV